jgi:hypothetical protein
LIIDVTDYPVIYDVDHSILVDEIDPSLNEVVENSEVIDPSLNEVVEHSEGENDIDQSSINDTEIMEDIKELIDDIIIYIEA